MIPISEGNPLPKPHDAFARGIEQFGGSSSELERLAEAVRRFERLEWEIVRRAPAAVTPADGD